MVSIHVICVGKMKEKFYIDGAAEYTKRLSGYCKLTITELPEERLPKEPSPAQIQGALAKEGANLLSKLSPRSTLVALCIEGKAHSSQQVADLISGWMQSGDKELVFAIGGSHGLHQDVKARATTKLSMSPMTFPHHLARVMLLEQIYRGFKIIEGSGYHK